jgi:hypothetical protein
VRPPAGNIPYGVFEDTGLTDNSTQFQAAIDDLQAHNMNSIMFTNGFAEYHEPMLNVSDAENFFVVSSWLMGDLNRDWWPDSVPATIENARSIIGPLVDQMAGHPSLKGWNIKDDATPNFNEKMRLVGQVIAERDNAPWSPMMVQGDLGHQVYSAVQPPVFLTYDYPAGRSVAPCSWVPTWLSEIRAQQRPPNVPFWFVLQTHQTGATGLRYPTVEEIRLQNWIALGEGADGIWWFIYSTQQSWLGLKDSPERYAEVTSLAKRTRSLPLLTEAADTHTASNGYVSDMGGDYIVMANTSCSSASLTLAPRVKVRNVETGKMYPAGAAIPFKGGDGGLFKIQ